MEIGTRTKRNHPWGALGKMGQGMGGGGLFLVRGAGVKNLDATSTVAKAEAGPKPMLGSAASVNCKTS